MSGNGRNAADAYWDAIHKDADRYRFLRDESQYSEEWSPHVLTRRHLEGHAPEYLVEEELDEAIDAALARCGAPK